MLLLIIIKLIILVPIQRIIVLINTFVKTQKSFKVLGFINRNTINLKYIITHWSFKTLYYLISLFSLLYFPNFVSTYCTIITNEYTFPFINK